VRFVLVHGGFHGAWCWDGQPAFCAELLIEATTRAPIGPLLAELPT